MQTEAIFSTLTDLWATPLEFFREYDKEYRFTVDAAADPHNHKHPRYFGPGGLKGDALLADWTGNRVWLNPPYSQCTAFLQKAANESLVNDVGSVVLLPSRTDTKWFHDYVYYSPYNCYMPWVKCVRWIKGRLRFNLHVTDTMREMALALREFDESDVSAETGLPKTILRAIYAGQPEIAESAPFPSLVVVMKGDWS